MAAISMSASAGAATTVKVSPGPVYNQTEPIPITVGLEVDESPAIQSFGKSHTSHPYGPAIVDELKKLKVFSNIVYPFKKGVSADAVLLLSIKGKWEYYNKEPGVYDTWAGSSPAHYAEGNHEIKVVMTKGPEGGGRIINDSVSVRSKGQFSGRDYDLIADRLNEAQTRKIAVTLANFLQDKQDHIMAKIESRTLKQAVSVSNAGSDEVKTAAKTGAGNEYKAGDKLKTLEELHSSGVLSDEDFNKAQTRVIQMQKLEDLYKSGVLTEKEYRRAAARVSGK